MNGFIVLIGVMAHKNETDVYYFYLSDKSSIFEMDDTMFIDNIFYLATSQHSNGNHPLVIHTGSQRYNKWGISDIDAKYFYACEIGTVEDASEPQGTRSQDLYSSLINKYLNILHFSVEFSFFDNLKNKFEFITSPKINLDDEEMTLSLITSPKNVYEAEKFCQLYSNGTLYDLKPDYKKVVNFAKNYGIHAFYISLSDKLEENNFTYPDGEELGSNFDSLWNVGEPNNNIPETNNFCES